MPMHDVETRFVTLLEETLIPHFCSKASRAVSPMGFRGDAARVSEIDTLDFMRGWEARLLPHIGGGLYRATASGASEQFFWEGRKFTVPRTFTLWLEPIITLGVLARMHLDFGWPRELIGTQSKPDWAFDVIGRKSESDLNLRVAGEVKKSPREIDALIGHMQRFCHQSVSSEPSKKAERNAFRKVQALRYHRPDVFWAIGPNRYEKAFSVEYLACGAIDLTPVSLQALNRNA